MDESHSTSTERDLSATARTSSGPRPGKILLAEGNRINQRIASRLLQIDGHQVTIVATGKQLLATLAQDTFDLVLIDPEMPDMTGSEVARVIREKEEASNRHLALVAMTSSTLEGDHCLQAGMDQYIAKPLTVESLRRVIASYVAPVAAAPAFDQAAALLRMGGDRAFLCTLASMFVEESSSHIAAIRSAVAEQDGERLSRAAHKIKGSAHPFCAAGVANAAQTLESIGESRDLATAPDEFRRFETELDRLIAALSALLCADGQTGPIPSTIAGPEGTIPCTA